MYSGTDFYGIRKTLLSYAKLPDCLPLPVAVQHGWQLVVTPFETVGNPPEIWVWSERIATEYYKLYPSSKVRVVGSPYCYLKKLLPENTLPVNRSGSICIPPHSSHFVSTEYSVEKFAQSLDELGDEYKPITVMLYYLDMNIRTISEYEKYGYKVVSNGSLFDNVFLSNFIQNVYDKQHCIFSDFGSGVLFSADLGLNLVHMQIKSRSVSKGDKYLNPDDEMVSKTRLLRENFFQELDRELTDLELGKPYLLSPSELRRVILRNYFTWGFLRTYSRRIVGKGLRSLGLIKKDEQQQLS
jgi:hypothetical protein